jgi:hypothetical protein
MAERNPPYSQMVLDDITMLADGFEAEPSYVYGTELKNIMEMFIQHIKDRTEYVLMIIFCVERRIVIGSMCGTLS